MAVSVGVNISKAVAYAVLDIPAGVDVSKAIAYAVIATVDPPVWTGAGFPNGLLSVAYSASVSLLAGSLPVTFSVLAGALPGGLSLSSSGLVATVSGSPTAVGTFAFTLRASNAYGIADQAFSITITTLGGTSYTFAA